MDTLEKFFFGAFALIFVYLVVSNPGGVNSVFNAFANFNVKTFGVLQGKDVRGF